MARRRQKLRGFTFVEILVGIALMLIVFLGIYVAFQSRLNVVELSKNKITAIAIANQQIEMVTNIRDRR
jgi:prepilin-type N-terminal cleavage/methylation domain-containing protein